MKVALNKLHSTLPAKPKPQYNGCLNPAELQRMAEIYKEARLSKIAKRPARKFNSYRPEFV